MEHTGARNPLESKHLFHFNMYSSHKSTLHSMTLLLHGINTQLRGCEGQPPIQLPVYAKAMVEQWQQNLLAFDFFEPVSA